MCGSKRTLEVETDNANAAANVEKCLKADLWRVVIIASTPEVKHGLLARLGQHPQAEVLTGAEAIARNWQDRTIEERG